MGVTKMFHYPVVPTHLLQESLLKPWSSKKKWSVEALKDISLSIQKGEWVGIYGPNGSGKTTLLKILAGIMKPDAGEIVRPDRLSCFFTLGVGFHHERTADENLYHYLLLQGIAPDDIGILTQKIISFASIESHRSLPIKCYSEGMQLRLGYSAAVNVDSDLYLLDEVLKVGDEQFQKQCEAFLLGMKAQRKTVIMVHHSLNELKCFCDRILFFKDGIIVREETVQPADALILEEHVVSLPAVSTVCHL